MSRKEFYRVGVEKLKELLRKLFQVEADTEIQVHYSENIHGIRIVEIDFVKNIQGGMAGATWFRSDIDGEPGLFLCCEDFVLEHATKPFRPKGWESDIDLHQETIEKLEQAVSKIRFPVSV
jgi:hypothetical protein